MRRAPHRAVARVLDASNDGDEDGRAQRRVARAEVRLRGPISAVSCAVAGPRTMSVQRSGRRRVMCSQSNPNDTRNSQLRPRSVRHEGRGGPGDAHVPPSAHVHDDLRDACAFARQLLRCGPRAVAHARAHSSCTAGSCQFTIVLRQRTDGQVRACVYIGPRRRFNVHPAASPHRELRRSRPCPMRLHRERRACICRRPRHRVRGRSWVLRTQRDTLGTPRVPDGLRGRAGGPKDVGSRGVFARERRRRPGLDGRPRHLPASPAVSRRKEQRHTDKDARRTVRRQLGKAGRHQIIIPYTVAAR